MRDRSKSEMHVLRPGVEVEQCLLVQENPGGIDGPRGRVSRDNLRCGLDRDPGEQVAITCLQKVDDLTQVTGLRDLGCGVTDDVDERVADFVEARVLRTRRDRRPPERVVPGSWLAAGRNVQPAHQPSHCGLQTIHAEASEERGHAWRQLAEPERIDQGDHAGTGAEDGALLASGLRLEGTSQERTGLFQMTGRKGLGQVQDLAGVYPVRTRPQGFDDLRDEASGLLGWYR